MTFQLGPDAVMRYMQRRQKDLAMMTTALSGGDFLTIQNIAHQIKGNAPTFGFKDLGERAKVLEKNALSANAEGLAADLRWIETWLKENLPTPGQSPRTISID